MHRWDPLNPIQLALLQRIDAGEVLDSSADSRSRTTGYALRNRGLVTIDRRGGRWAPQITDAGRYYLEHGQHPDHPARLTESTATAAPSPTTSTAGQASKVTASKPARVTAKPAARTGAVIRLPARSLAEATDLVARLVAENKVIVAGPSDEAIANWRRLIEYAKRHKLLPLGKRIETQRHWNTGRDFEIRLVDGVLESPRQGPQPDLAPVPVPTQLRTPNRVVAALRDDTDRLVMPAQQRHRALLLFEALAAEAVRRGHQVRDRPVSEHHRSRPYYYNGRNHPSSYSRREGELDIVIDGFHYTVTIQQESPQSNDPEKAAHLTLDLSHYRATRQCTWHDRKRWTLEDILPLVLEELQQRSIEDRQRAVDEKREKAERQIRWEAAMAAAKEQAVQEQYAKQLRQQAKRWREAAALRAYCDALEERLDSAQETEGSADHMSATSWLAWARDHALNIDPLTILPTMPEPRKVELEDLKPFLHGWSPHGPEGNRSGWL